MGLPFLSRVALRVALGMPLLVAGVGLPVVSPAVAAGETTGAKGAQVYCFLRANGNSHEVSWAAAYALIKRQSAGLFKTSPEHAAVMITESVVGDPARNPDCGRFLGDLYRRRVPPGAVRMESAPEPSIPSSGVPVPSQGMIPTQRYGS